jgi:hypothetical protein
MQWTSVPYKHSHPISALSDFVTSMSDYLAPSLEHNRQVGETKEHHCWFIESFISDECCLPPILFFDKNFIIPPLNIKPCEEGAPLELVN